MTERFETMKLSPLPEGNETASDILEHVYRALQGKGYESIDQFKGKLALRTSDKASMLMRTQFMNYFAEIR